MGTGDLPLLVLKDVRVGALENAGQATLKAHGVFAENAAATAGFNADEAD